MKFGLLFVNTGAFIQPEGVAELAKMAEDIGIESLWTVEHVAVPHGYESQYPYSRDGKMPGTEDAPIPDPLIWLAYAAALTSKIKLATGVLILPQRHPIYAAKEVATLDVLSKGRVICGVGIGWLEEEFQALGIPFKQRVSRTEEAVAAMRTLWRQGAHSFSSKHFNWGPLECNPKPVQGERLPIVVGGHVDAAARRAARIGDGFFPAKGKDEELSRLFDAIKDECEKIGRNPDEIELTAGGPVRSPDDHTAIRKTRCEARSHQYTGARCRRDEARIGAFQNGCVGQALDRRCEHVCCVWE